MGYILGTIPNQKYRKVYYGGSLGTFANMFRTTALSGMRNAGTYVKASGKSLINSGVSMAKNKNLQNVVKNSVLSVAAPVASVGLNIATEMAKAKALDAIQNKVQDETLNNALSNVVAKAPIAEAVTQIAHSSSPEDLKHNVKQLVNDTKEYVRREGKEKAIEIAKQKGEEVVSNFAPVVLDKVNEVASNAGVDQAKLAYLMGYGLKKRKATTRKPKRGGMIVY